MGSVRIVGAWVILVCLGIGCGATTCLLNYGQAKSFTQTVSDLFGSSVTISSDTVAVGAPYALFSDGNYRRGVTYIYERSTGGTNAWGLQATLTGPSAESYFGRAVSLSGSLLAVGSPGFNHFNGAVTVYARSGTTWTSEARVEVAAAAAVFGTSVSLAGTFLVAGAPESNSLGANSGAAFVRERNSGAWSAHAQLMSSDVAANARFGDAVALLSDPVDARMAAVVGAPGTACSGGELSCGAAYIFVRGYPSTNGWGMVQRLIGADTRTGDGFGNSVAIYGDVIAVGASGNTNFAGAVYLYTRYNLTYWQFTRKLSASTFGLIAFDNFGSSVALSSATLVVGAQDRSIKAGTVLVFDLFGNLNATLTAIDARANQFLGYSVAVENGVVVAGAPAEENSDTGEAYIFGCPLGKGGVACNLVDCCRPDAPTSGSLPCYNTTEGASCSVACNIGFTNVGPSAISCQHAGTWTYYTNNCTANCGVLVAPTNGVMSCPTADAVGGTCTTSCNTGFVLSGSSSRQCLTSSVWSGTAASCPAQACFSQPQTTPSSGSVSCSTGPSGSSGFTTFNVCTYSCNIGFLLVGTSARQCIGSESWTGTTVSCTPVDCGVAQLAPTNGALSCPLGVGYGATCTASCNTGYAVVGTVSRVCQANATWTGVNATCAVDCGPSQTSLADGVVACPGGTTVGNTCTATCNTGFALIGSTSRTCQATAVWTGTAASCLIDCGTPTVPTNGIQTCAGGTYLGRICLYSCNTGYLMAGATARECLATGLYNVSAPTCTPVDCGPLSTPALGTMSCANGTTFGNSCLFSCNLGYALVSSASASRVCQSTGLWGGTNATCALVDCGVLATPDRGTGSCPNGTTFGYSCSFTCNAGNSMVGSAVRYCTSTGSWNGTTTLCAVVDALTTPSPGLSRDYLILIICLCVGFCLILLLILICCCCWRRRKRRRDAQKLNSSEERVLAGSDEVQMIKAAGEKSTSDRKKGSKKNSKKGSKKDSKKSSKKSSKKDSKKSSKKGSKKSSKKGSKKGSKSSTRSERSRSKAKSTTNKKDKKKKKDGDNRISDRDDQSTSRGHTESQRRKDKEKDKDKTAYATAEGTVSQRKRKGSKDEIELRSGDIVSADTTGAVRDKTAVKGKKITKAGESGEGANASTSSTRRRVKKKVAKKKTADGADEGGEGTIGASSTASSRRRVKKKVAKKKTSAGGQNADETGTASSRSGRRRRTNQKGAAGADTADGEGTGAGSSGRRRVKKKVAKKKTAGADGDALAISSETGSSRRRRSTAKTFSATSSLSDTGEELSENAALLAGKDGKKRRSKKDKDKDKDKDKKKRGDNDGGAEGEEGDNVEREKKRKEKEKRKKEKEKKKKKKKERDDVAGDEGANANVNARDRKRGSKSSGLDSSSSGGFTSALSSKRGGGGSRRASAVLFEGDQAGAGRQDDRGGAGTVSGGRSGRSGRASGRREGGNRSGSSSNVILYDNRACSLSDVNSPRRGSGRVSISGARGTGESGRRFGESGQSGRRSTGGSGFRRWGDEDVDLDEGDSLRRAPARLSPHSRVSPPLLNASSGRPSWRNIAAETAKGADIDLVDELQVTLDPERPSTYRAKVRSVVNATPEPPSRARKKKRRSGAAGSRSPEGTYSRGSEELEYTDGADFF